MASQTQQADGDAEHGRYHNPGERDPQRVGHAGGERAQVAVACGVVDQQLANIEAGGVAQEIEARPDLARIEIGDDIARDVHHHRDEQESEQALDQPCAP